jgi:hypothetical protein
MASSIADVSSGASNVLGSSLPVLISRGFAWLTGLLELSIKNMVQRMDRELQGGAGPKYAPPGMREAALHGSQSTDSIIVRQLSNVYCVHTSLFSITHYPRQQVRDRKRGSSQMGWSSHLEISKSRSDATDHRCSLNRSAGHHQKSTAAAALKTQSADRSRSTLTSIRGRESPAGWHSAAMRAARRANLSESRGSCRRHTHTHTRSRKGEARSRPGPLQAVPGTRACTGDLNEAGALPPRPDRRLSAALPGSHRGLPPAWGTPSPHAARPLSPAVTLQGFLLTHAAQRPTMAGASREAVYADRHGAPAYLRSIHDL